MNTDFARARASMIESQIRTSDVTTPEILAAFRAVPRAEFAPAASKAVAYGDMDIDLAPGRVILAARVHAKLLQALKRWSADAARTRESLRTALALAADEGNTDGLPAQQSAAQALVESRPDVDTTRADGVALQSLLDAALAVQARLAWLAEAEAAQPAEGASTEAPPVPGGWDALPRLADDAPVTPTGPKFSGWSCPSADFPAWVSTTGMSCAVAKAARSASASEYITPPPATMTGWLAARIAAMAVASSCASGSGRRKRQIFGAKKLSGQSKASACTS
jgi:protein-L-isoaspartate(D-aspartate) O-methyltransferase